MTDPREKYMCEICWDKGYLITHDPINGRNSVFDPKSFNYVTACECTDSNPTPRGPRPKWDEIWMVLATTIGQRSTCKVPDRSIGCVIVSGDNTKVLALGYNGSAKGDTNECEYDGDEVKVGSSRCTCVHAEMNALTKLDTSNPCYKKMYITLSPCNLCYKLIVNAGIDEVIYLKEHKLENHKKLSTLGVKVRKYNENN